MRNLKKVLSLALALAMLVSMMIVGASAATALDVYTDAEDITYKEAVDLLTAIDVLQGDEGGFRPTDTLTREEAAKIVAYVSLGVDAAEALTVTKAPFTDVAATRWSAGYIAYCANVGIINGMGDGTFRPTDTVTGYQMAKMLLCCIGYGVNDEYTGSNWALNVGKDGVTTGLFDRLSNVGNTAATREEAAQLAFNAVTMPMVAYSALYGTYSSYTYQFGQQELLGTKAVKIFNVDTASYDDDLSYTYHYWHYIGKAAPITDNYLSDEIMGRVTTGTVGAMYKSYPFAEAVTIWENGNSMNTLPNYVLGEERLDGVFTLNNNNQRVYYGFSTETMKNKTTDVITYNGQYIDVIDSDHDGEADKLIIVTNYLAKVTKVTAATASAERTVTAEVYLPNQYSTISTTFETENYAVGDYILVTPNGTVTNITNAAPVAANPGQGIAAMTGREALVAAFGNVVADEAAEVISGAAVTAYFKLSTSVPSVTTGGVRYSYNGIFNAVNWANEAVGYLYAADGYSLNKDAYNLYLDSTGNVIGVEQVANIISDFAYIVGVGEDAFQTFNTVKVVLSDGSVGTYTVSAQSSKNYETYAAGNVSDLDANNNIYDTTAHPANGGLADEGVGRIYGYSFDANGDIILTALTGTKYANAAKAFATTGTNLGNIYTFTKGYSTISYKETTADNTWKSVFATDTTVFAYINNGVVTMYTGKNNAPSISATEDKGTWSGMKPAAIATQTIGGTTYATFVVVVGAPEADMGTNFVYVTKTGVAGKSTDTKGAPVYYYNVIKDGVATIIATTNACNAADQLATGTGVYRYAFDADLFISDEPNRVESGEYTLQKATADDGVKSIVIDVSSNGNVIVDQNGVGDGKIDQPDQYIITAETDITDVSGNVPVVDAEFKVGDTVTVVYGKQGNLQVAKAVFITSRAAGTTPSVPGGIGGVSEGATITLSGAGTGTIAVVDRYNTERDAMTIATDTLEANGFTVNQVVGTSVYATAANGTQVYFTVSTTVAYKVNLVKANGNNVTMSGPSAVYATTNTPVEVTLTLSGAAWSSETGSATSNNVSATVASVTDTKSGNTMTVNFTISTTGVAAEGATVTIGW